MELKNTRIDTLFAEPMFRASIAESISPEQVEYIQSLPMVQNQTNLISEDKYIFNDPKLASIGEAVQQALDVYAD